MQIEQPFPKRPWLPALGLLVLLAGCATDAVTGKRVTNWYSINEDIDLGQTALQHNISEMERAGVPINRDKNQLRLLEEMVGRITAVSDMPDLPYSVTLFHTNMVNAAAFPGGSMMVFEGLYDQEIGLVEPNDEDELAVVLAHEVAHVTCRHATERATKARVLTVGGTVGLVVLDASGYGGVAQVTKDAMNVAGALWFPAHTRKSEAEADIVGLRYMAKAGYDPRAAPRIWKRALQNQEEFTSVFSTHPSYSRRYENLMQHLPEAMELYRQATGSYPADYTP